MVAFTSGQQLDRVIRHNLKRGRCTAHLTIAQLAFRAALPVGLVKSYEVDVRSNDEQHLLALAAALEIPFLDLFKINGSFILLLARSCLLLLSIVGALASIAMLASGYFQFASFIFAGTVLACLIATLLPTFIYPENV